jgi:CHAT domain-containing protein
MAVYLRLIILLGMMMWTINNVEAKAPKNEKDLPGKNLEALPETIPELTELKKVLAKAYHEADMLSEKDKIYKTSSRLVEITQKLCTLVSKNFPETSQELKVTRDEYLFIARRHVQFLEKQRDFDAAIELRKNILACTTLRWGTNHANTRYAKYYADNATFLATLTDQQLDELDHAQSLTSEAVFGISKNNLTNATMKLQEALEIKQRILGENHADFATAHYELAMCYHKANDLAAAETHYQKALEIREKALGEISSPYASTLNKLADLYKEQKQYDKARVAYAQSMNIANEVLVHTDATYLNIIDNVADFYDFIADHPTAKRIRERALLIMKNIRNYKVFDHAMQFDKMVQTCIDMHDYKVAKQYVLESMVLKKANNYEKTRFYVISQIDLARIHHHLNEIKEADALFESLKQSYEMQFNQQEPLYAMILGHYAELLMKEKNFESSALLFDRSLEIGEIAFKSQPLVYAKSLNTAGKAFTKMSKLDRAKLCLTRAYEIRTNELGSEHFHTNYSRKQLATYYKSSGEYAESAKLYQDIVEYDRKQLGETHEAYIYSLNQLANVNYCLQNYPSAILLHEEVQEIQKTKCTRYHPDYLITLMDLGLCHMAMENYALALPYFRECFDNNMHVLSQITLEPRSYMQLKYESQTALCLNYYLSCAQKAHAPIDEIYATVLNWKNSNVLRSRAFKFCKTTPQWSVHFDLLKKPVTTWKNSINVSHSPEQYQKWLKDNSRIESEIKDLTDFLIEECPSYRNATLSMTLAEVEKSIPQDATLIDYFEYLAYVHDPSQPAKFVASRQLLAFVVSANHEIQLINIGAVEPLEDATERWLTSYGTMPDAIKAGQLLIQKLWQPVVPYLTDIKLVMISPDGALGNLPFHALPGHKPDTFLIEDYALVVIPVVKLLPSYIDINDVEDYADPIVFMGNIDYDHQVKIPIKNSLSSMKEPDLKKPMDFVINQFDWEKLPDTKHEIEVIKEIYKPRRNYSKIQVAEEARASIDYFMDDVRFNHIVHLATHAYFAVPEMRSVHYADANQQPFDHTKIQTDDWSRFQQQTLPGSLSGLVFAGANPFHDSDMPITNQQRNAYLTCADIANLIFDDVSIVVVSNCDNGVKETASGEGPLNLQRAFQVSGAKSLLISHWKLDGEQRIPWLKEFYTNLEVKKLGKLDSLREAQLAYLKRVRAEVASTANKPAAEDFKTYSLSPYHWATFTLSGYWK